jgi:hypothetical protein
MCISPHEMTSARIEEEIEMLEKYISDYCLIGSRRSFYEGRIENLRVLLKERAEDGTYHDNTGRR